ncbi:MAG: hypothetical protein NC124_05915 [Clostridium sp.]|nr:hypothetical protein [Clostridium sp.]
METKWEYDLPTNEHSKDYQYESPIFIKDHTIYFISDFERQLRFHRIDAESGEGKTEDIPSGNKAIPSKFFFLAHKEKIIFYTGDFYVYHQSEILKMTDLQGSGSRNKVGSYLLHGSRLLFSYASTEDYLFCYNLDSLSMEWKINITNSTYMTGELTLFENMAACYGDHELLLIEMESGKIADRIKIPRIDKLFHPIRLDEEHILLGVYELDECGYFEV